MKICENSLIVIEPATFYFSIFISIKIPYQRNNQPSEGEKNAF